MKIFYIGDIMALPGQKVVSQLLPGYIKEYGIDFVIAQAENSDPEGHGPRFEDLKAMQASGVDFFTGGNHSLRGKETEAIFSQTEIPIVRPANMKDAPGSGYKIVDTPHGKILIASMLSQIVGNQRVEMENPLHTVETIYEENQDIKVKIINIHGDFSSEKRVFGYYLDGRFSAVIGDHWHVPTADAMILPNGTAHISDVGMCGTLHSSLGVKTNVITERWKTNHSSRNQIETEGPLQFNAVLIDIDETTGLSRSIELIQRIVEQDV
jgi:metallophosphoesterase (TIGR00282 family)